MLCQTCGKPLVESQHSSDGTYKSCPRCSVLHGEEHVYFKYPEEFGTTTKRSSVKHPEGPQSYCMIHRNDPDHALPIDGILCSEVEG